MVSIDGEAQLVIVSTESLEKEGFESRSTTDKVKNKEASKVSAVIGKLFDSVQGEIDNFRSNGVISSGQVIGNIFLS